MKAMILAAGVGNRLRPLTATLPKPMVPVLDKPVMEHILDLLVRHGYTDVIANVHYLPGTIVEHFGNRITYHHEPRLLGTAGGVEACASFFGDEPLLVISGDALTDLDLTRMRLAHEANGGIATLAVKEVTDTSQYGVVVHDADGRIVDFQEKPAPEQARSRLANCGIYMLQPEIFHHFPLQDQVDWANDVFPRLLEAGEAFHVHQLDGQEYWNDIGSLAELKAGTFDALRGALLLDAAEDPAHRGDGRATIEEDPVWVHEQATIGSGVTLFGPVVIGAGATIGDGASLRDVIVLPGATVPVNGIAIGSIIGVNRA